MTPIINPKYSWLFLALIISISCKEQPEEINNPSINDSEIAVSKAQFKAWNMRIGRIDEKSFNEYIEVSGKIDVPPENRAIVSAIAGGYIKTSPPLVGNEVKKGDLILKIENPEFIKIQQEYLEANEQLLYLKSEYDRHQKMKMEQVISEKSFLKAESAYKTTKARHAGLKKQLQLLNISTSRVEEGVIGTTANIYAPISGSITRVNAAIGSFVTPQTEIIEIVNNDHIHLELMVFEKDIMKLKKGQVIKFIIPESSEEEFEAEIYLIGNTIDDSRTVQVHAHLLNEDQTNFIVGMFAEARIELGTQMFSAVPKSAIAGFGSDSKILVLANTSEDYYYFDVLDIDIIRYEDDLVAISSSDVDLSKSQVLLNGARLAITQ